MIKRIHDLVERLAREHKLVNTFKYEMLSKSAGSGEDITPLVFLEMPIYFNNMVTLGGVIKATFNIDIVLNPQALHNYEIPQLTGADCQADCITDCPTVHCKDEELISQSRIFN